jgi:hypothetical protein
MSSHQSPINTSDDAPNNQAAAAPYQLQIVEEIPDPNSQLVHCITQRQESPTKNPSKEDEEGEEDAAASSPPPPSTPPSTASPDVNNNGNNNNTTTLQDSAPQRPQDQEEPPQDKADNCGSGGDGNNKVLDDAQPQDVVEPPQDKVASPTTAPPSSTANLKTPSLWDQLEESSSNNPSLHNFDDLIIPSVNHPQATNYLRESFDAWTTVLNKHAMPEPSSNIFQYMEMAIMLCHLHEFWKQPNPLRLPTPGTRVDFVGQHCISYGLHHRTVPHYYKKSGGGVVVMTMMMVEEAMMMILIVLMEQRMWNLT